MKKLSQIAIAFMMLMAAVPAVNAQNIPGGKRPARESFAKIQAQQIAEELALDDTKSDRFIELFSACQKEIWECSPKKKQKNNDKKGITEDEARKIIAERFAHRKKIDEIQERYYKEYSKFLTQKQILQIYNYEKRMMDRMFREHMKGHGKKRVKGSVPPSRPPTRMKIRCKFQD